MTIMNHSFVLVERERERESAPVSKYYYLLERMKAEGYRSYFSFRFIFMKMFCSCDLWTLVD